MPNFSLLLKGALLLSFLEVSQTFILGSGSCGRQLLPSHQFHVSPATWSRSFSSPAPCRLRNDGVAARAQHLWLRMTELNEYEEQGLRFIKPPPEGAAAAIGIQAPPKEGTASQVGMEELALFRIGRVLLPGAQFPLQIFKHKKATQAMFVKEAKRSGTVGVVFSPEGSEGSFATCGCEAQIESLTHLDDGRLIVECTGTRRFHVEGIRQAEPYVKAHVKFDEDDGGAAEEDLIASCEVDCWKTLQEVIWLCVEVWDKRTFAALLMGEAERHPLHRYRQASPGSCIGEGTPFTSERERRKAFSWHMTRIVRNGVPGLWDHDMTDTLKTPYDIQKMMEIDCEEERLLSCLDVFQTARDHLRLRQRLKNIIDKRIPLDGEASDADERGGDKE